MTSPVQTLPMVYASGSHYDVGFAIGSTFSTRVLSYWNQSEKIQKKLVPFYDCRKGRELFDVYLRGAEKVFPEYVSEIKGTADGAGLPFEKLFLLNISKEVYYCHYDDVVNPQTKHIADDQGCTTVFVNHPQVKLLVQNEDCEPKIGAYGYMVSARITRDVESSGLITCDTEHFTAYSNPGTLSGSAFGFNGHGLILTMNALCPDSVSVGAPTRHFLNRALLAAESVDACAKIAGSEYGSAYGFNANVASILDTKTMASIEVSPGVPASFHVETFREADDDTTSCHYIHANEYKHITVREKDLLEGSMSRTKRANEMPPPRTLPDVKSILGDTFNSRYPIYRSASGVDKGKTVATVAFDVLKRTMEIYMENPKLGNAPLVSLPVTCDIEAKCVLP